MKEIIKKIIPLKYHGAFFKFFVKPFRSKYRRSYSQCGEDMILDTIFSGYSKGIYVDIGANNPKIQSNTQYFYEKGWHGINIDANPTSMMAFNKIRKRDINLNIPISDTEEILNYYIFSSSFFNTFSKEQAEIYKDMLTDTKELKTSTLEKIFDIYLKEQKIDFMTIDTEGWDYKVLKSNNWNKYRPKVIITEYLIYENEKSINDVTINDFLKINGYQFFCSTPCNSIFINIDFIRERFPIVND